MDWFTSDTHAFHANIIKYSQRPFGNVEEMNRVMADNINAMVMPQDTLHHLGDWSYWKDKSTDTVRAFRGMINCRNVHLIYGNHDKQIRGNNNYQHIFASRKDLDRIKIDGQDIITCHYAMRVWEKSHHSSWCLYGHSHASLPDDPNALSIDVGIDTKLFGHEYMTPYNMDELNAIMKKKKWKPVDHHTGTKPI